MEGQQFHFCEDIPEAGIAKDMVQIGKMPTPALTVFMGHILSFLAGQPSSELMASMTTFANDNGIPISSLQSPLRSILIFLRGALRYRITPAQLQSDLQQFGMSDSAVEEITKMWKASISSISLAVSSQTLHVNQLVDLDWKFGVTSAGSEMFKIGSTFLQLRMSIDKGDGGPSTPLHFEMTLPQFYDFVHEIEQAKLFLEVVHG